MTFIRQRQRREAVLHLALPWAAVVAVVEPVRRLVRPRCDGAKVMMGENVGSRCAGGGARRRRRENLTTEVKFGLVDSVSLLRPAHVLIDLYARTPSVSIMAHSRRLAKNRCDIPWR